MSFYPRLIQLLAGDSQGVLFKTFTNGMIDQDYSVVEALVENDGASITTAAQYLKAIKNAQISASSETLADICENILNHTISLEALVNTLATAGVINQAGEAHIGQIGGTTTRIALEFTRPANVTPYTANDVVSSGAALELTNALRTDGGSGYITSLTVTTDNATAMIPRLRVHFGRTNTSCGTIVTDNSAVANDYNLLSSPQYLGYIDLPAMVSTGASGSAYSTDITSRFPITGKVGEGTKIYCLIETLDGFTPSSGQKFTVSVGIEQN